MSSAQVKGAIAAVLGDGDFAIAAARTANAKLLARELLHTVEQNKSKFDVFSEGLLRLIKKAVIKDRRLKQSTRRERMWTTFHGLRVGGELSALWSAFMDDVGIQNSDTGKPCFACFLCHQC